MSLEQTVRPFQDRNIAPGVLILDDTKVDDPVVQSIGSEGGTTFDYSYSFNGSNKSTSKDDWKETKRKSTEVKITNPDDSDQSVTTKRADRVEFNDTATGKQKRSYNFKYPDLAVG